MDDYQPNDAPAPQYSAPKSNSSNTAVKVIAIGCGGLLLLGLIAGGIFTWYAAKKAKEFVENPAYGSLKLAVMASPELESVSSDAEAGTITVLDKRTGKTTTLTVNSMKDGKLTIEADGSKIEMAGGQNGEGQMVIRGKNGETVVATGGPGGGSLVVTGADGKVQVNAQGGPAGQVAVQAGGDAPEPNAPAEEGGGQGAAAVAAGGNTVRVGAAGGGGPQMPAWVPSYPGATPDEGGGMVSTTGAETTGAFGFVTTDPPNKVVASYAELLPKSGLAVQSKMEMGEGGLVVATSADGKRQVTVTISSQDGKTQIAVMFVAKQ